MKKIILFVAIIIAFVFHSTAQVSVTATAGTTGPTSYTTLNAAFTAINAGTHQGVINVNITANTTEPATPVPLLRSAAPSSYTKIRIKPNSSGIVINSAATPTTGRGIIELLGADNVTIDGCATVGGTTKDLTIQSVTATTTGQAVIRLSSNSTTGTDGADNDTIKNCNIIGARSSATSTVTNYGIVFSNASAAITTTVGAYSSINTIIQNNTITRCYHGIYAQGTSATYPNTGTQILGNIIGSATSANNIGSRGILLSYTATTGTGALVQGNDIRVGDYGSTGYATTIAGLEIGTVNYGVTVTRNNIHDINQPNTGGYGAHGIYITGSTNNTLSTITNNFIRDCKMVVYQTSSTSTYIPCGVFFTAGATGVNFNNNTIVMGTQLGSGTNFSSFCVNASLAGVRISSFQNNIIANTVTSTFAFGLYCNTTLNISGGTVNNNNYNVPGGHVGYYNAGNRTTLSDWQSATSKDANSKNVNPVFKSTTDLHIDTASTATNIQLFQTGEYLASVTTDIDAESRNNPPCIGADEFRLPVCTGAPTAGTITAATSPLCSGASTTLSLSGATSGVGITYQWQTASVLAGPYSNMGTSSTQATGALSATTYYKCIITCTTSSSVDSTAVYTLTVNTTPTVTVSGSATKYCGNTPVTLTASGATTYTWSAITDLFTNATGTTAYTSLLDANPVYSKANANITYTVVGTTSGCTASSTIAVNKGTFVTISSVTAQSPSACAGGTDSISVVASVVAPVSSYAFASSTGASLDPMTGATVYFGSGIDNAAGSYTLTTFPSGFVFPYEGVNQTQFTISENGVMRLGSAAVSTTQYGSITGQSLLLSVAGADMGSGTDGGVSYVLTGTAPNRIFKVQFKTKHTWSTTTAINCTFQVWLYETSGKIEYRFGSMASTGTPAHGIGLSGATTTNYQSVAVSTGLSSTSTITSNTTLPASGTMYTFTPPSAIFAWTSLNPSNTLIDNTLRTAVATVNATGKYQIVVSETGGCSALDSSLTVTLGGGVPTDTISAIPVATVAAKVCPGTSVTLSNTGLIGGCSPFTHKWNTGATTTTLTISPTVTTTYYDTITDASSQVVIGSYTVNVHPIVTASISPSTVTVCGTSPVTLTASGGATYRWSVNGSAAVTGLFTTTAATTAYTAGANQNPMYARPVSATTYAVTVTDANTCTAITTRTIAVGSPVTITSVTPQTLSACSGGTDSITVVASVASTASSYAFSSGTGASFLTIPSPTTLTTVVNGSVDDGSNPVTPSPTFSFPFAGVNYTDFNVNTNGWMKMLTAAPATNIPSSLTSIGSTTGIFMFGRDANLNTANGGSITHGAAAGGKYVIQFNNNSGGGGGVASATSYVNAQIVLWGSTSSSPGKIEIIYGTSIGTPGSNGTIGIVDIANTYMNAVTGNSIATTTVSTWPASGTMYTFTPPTLTYAWTSLNPSNTLINTTLPTTVATITDTGKFQIVVTEAGGCSALDSTVKIFLGGGNPNITAMNTTNNSYCYTDSTTLSTTVLGGCPPYAYSWSGGLGSTASVKAKPTTTTKYYVTVTDNNTNVDIDSITVTIISPQILTVLGDTICGTDTARLSATANAGDSIVWYRSATGTNIVKFGANLDTVLSANDTFYVGATVITGTNTYNVGPPARVAALSYFISNNWGITFNASEPCVINSVAIYPSTAGIISIRAQSSMTTPTIFGTYSMNITVGQIGTKVIVPVNFVIPTAGTGYKMIVEAATTVTGLHRETPPAPGFAYSTVGSPISLPSSEWGGTTTGTYYFFYDWSVTKTTYCQSSRTPVVVVRNTPPTISATAPTFVCIGESVALNVTSPNDPNYTYTWNPGSLSGASQTVTPGSTTTYTVNAYDAITGCRASKDTIVQVRPYPTKPILNVDSVYLCNGTVQPLNITNGFNSGTASATSGTISLAIPDNSATGISSILNLSTVPTGATIDSVAVTFNLNHAYLADAEVTLTAPNGKVIALAADQGPSGTGSYVNTRISSNSANPALSSTSTPISGTYRANATVAGSLKGSFGANLTSTFSDLFTTANGNWTLTAFDDAPTDLGTLTSYSIDIYYRNTTSYSWTPTASLYTNAPATNGYTSGDSLTLYAKNTVNTNYISTATLNGCSTSDTAKYVIKSSSSSIALFSASTNGSPLTLDCEDAGWTYYADPSNNNRWLFGIDWDTNIVAKSTAQIVLDYNTTGVIKDVKQRPGSSADYDGAYILRRYWNVNNATLNPGSTPVKIRFFYDPADTTAARDSMDVNRVAYATASPGGNPYYATPWKWFKTVGVAFTPALINDGNNFSFSNIELTPSAMSTLNGVSYVQFDNITSFSGGSGGIGFTPHSGGVGLPVTLVSFAGNVEEAHNHIQWTTASELNNDHFELESSVDGKNFTTLATISGHGTTTETHQYSFNDYKYNMPSTYYRLKQVDFDGKSTTTNMIILTRMSNASTSAVVSVYPNPTNDITTLSIDVQENAEATYTIHDITGKIVSEGAINCIAGMNNTTIQTGDLADGMYIVDVLINGKHINTRLVKSTK